MDTGFRRYDGSAYNGSAFGPRLPVDAWAVWRVRAGSGGAGGIAGQEEAGEQGG